MENISVEDFFWLVGILEGEGSFLKGPPSKPKIPLINMQSKDEDVIARVARLFEVTYYKITRKKPKPNRSQMYGMSFRSRRVITWMKKFLPHMSIRRQQQIRNALASTSHEGTSLHKNGT